MVEIENSNFSSNISADESSPKENTLSCSNFVFAGGKKLFIKELILIQ